MFLHEFSAGWFSEKGVCQDHVIQEVQSSFYDHEKHLWKQKVMGININPGHVCHIKKMWLEKLTAPSFYTIHLKIYSPVQCFILYKNSLNTYLISISF